MIRHLAVFPLRVSRWEMNAEDHVRRWVRDSGLVSSDRARERFERTAPGSLTARVYALASKRRRLEVCADWIGWLFLIDDQFDEGDTGRSVDTADRLIARLLPVLDDAQPGPTSLALSNAFADVRERLLLPMPEHWRRRFDGHVRDYLTACRWESANRQANRTPTVTEFPAARRDAGAIWPSLDLLEYAIGETLPDCLYLSEPFQELVTAAADVVCWTDDIFTVEKERAHGDVHNYVLILERYESMSPEQATHRLEDMIAKRVAEFQKIAMGNLANLQEQALKNASYSTVSSILSGLRDWMRGHLDWGMTTVRYQHLAYPLTEGKPS
ncbi:MAG: terpene synthase family protein [Actinophytocola sp.]|uniref:terpene synthase family protein n=1 Tax=Actinophytocola sp. TaxID=1872138 RepID=UPI003C74ACEE